MSVVDGQLDVRGIIPVSTHASTHASLVLDTGSAPILFAADVAPALSVVTTHAQ